MNISLKINGQKYTVNSSTVPIDTSLNTFIRQNAQLTGTKFMCLEGGCGVCLVTLKGLHPVTQEPRTWAVNSCLAPVFACHELDVITVEGIGNQQDGFHPIQKKLYECSGSQCGYCSSGMIVNMYSLLDTSSIVGGVGGVGAMQAVDIENSFGGNICRCTGYRPILDAFKALAVDGECAFRNQHDVDIEDLGQDFSCSRLAKPQPSQSAAPLVLFFDDDRQWHRCTTVRQILDIFDQSGNKLYQLVAGNTAHGVYRRSPDLQIFIDVNGVAELHEHRLDATVGTGMLTLGANISLTETMAILQRASTTAGFEYCAVVRKHIDLIANVPVRNAGSLAGNLAIKMAHPEFPSDLFLVLETVGAFVSVRQTDGNTLRVTVEELRRMDLNKKVMVNVMLPQWETTAFRFRSYKIMPRAQNAHAYVNAGFLLEMEADGERVRSIRICYGGINPSFVHATKTESVLAGRDLFSNETLQLAVDTLKGELRPDAVLPDAEPMYRRDLAIALFYRFVLSVAPADKLSANVRSAAAILERPLSSGVQSFESNKKLYPLTEPVLKLEGLSQVSGAALYANDLPPMKGELWAAYVLAGRPHVLIGRIDAKEALRIPGVYAFYSAADIPGVNSFAPNLFLFGYPEEIFVGVDSPVQFHGQPIGVILAETMALANAAALHVKVTYVEPPSEFSLMSTALSWIGSKPSPRTVIPTLRDALDENATDRFTRGDRPRTATAVGLNAVAAHIDGHLDFGSQYHFTMEPQTCVCIPNVEDELEVYCATQWPDLAHCAIAQSLNIAENRINLTVRRLGGAYGAKISRSSQVACACALAAHLSGRPVRFVLTIEANMTTCGKRYALACDYAIDADANGRIQRLTNDFQQDSGCSLNEPVPYFTLEAIANCYMSDTWHVDHQQVTTDAPSNTFCRAPGTTEAVAMIEWMMEHIAFATGRDPIDVRLANCPPDSEMHRLMPEFLRDVAYAERRAAADAFNAANRWRKRGIAVTPMRYPLNYFGGYDIYVAVYHQDGTVAVCHSGVECGQGINTKVAQVTAHALGIPLEAVRVKTLNNLVAANAYVTGGSLTSEMVCYAAIKACDDLLARLQPIRAKLPPTATWAEITSAANAAAVDLTVKQRCVATELKPYDIWGLSCAEVELDVLTGAMLLQRVDILEDTGESMSPAVDVGQVEGAFVMGLGYWLSESLKFDRIDGELLTNRTWTYKPPGAKDIPVDFRVRFLQKSSNPCGVLRSKATGEPAFCMAVVVVFALRYALASARKDAGIPTNEWFQLGSASTPDVIHALAGTKPEQFAL